GGAITHMATFARALAKLDDFRVVLITNERFEYPGIEVRTPWRGSSIRFIGPILHKLRMRFLARDYRGEGHKVALFPQILTEAHLGAARKAGCFTVSWVNGNAIIDN